MQNTGSVWATETISETKKNDQAYLQRKMDEFLSRGGKIGKPGDPAPELSEEARHLVAGAERSRKRATAKQIAEAEAKMKQNMPQIMELHLAGKPLSTIARVMKVSVAALKRALFQAGEEPARNSNTLAAATVRRLMAAAADGMTDTEAAKHAGVSISEARRASSDYLFKYGKNKK